MKFWIMIVMIAVLAVIFQLGGVQIDGMSQIFNVMGLSFDSNGISHFNFWTALFNLIISQITLSAIAGAVIIGFFTKATPENYLVGGVTGGTLYIFGSMIYSLVNYTIAFQEYLALGVLSPILVGLGIGFGLSMLEFFRGTD